MAKQALHDFGQVNILLNNAGINIRGPIEELSVEQFKEVQEINVWILAGLPVRLYPPFQGGVDPGG